jgi:hypothetical protein
MFSLSKLFNLGVCVFKAIIFLILFLGVPPPPLWWGLLCSFLVHGIFLGFVVIRVGFFILVPRCVVLIGGAHLCLGQNDFSPAMEVSSFSFLSFLFVVVFLGAQVRNCSCVLWVLLLVGGAVLNSHILFGLPSGRFPRGFLGQNNI